MIAMTNDPFSKDDVNPKTGRVLDAIGFTLKVLAALLVIDFIAGMIFLAAA